MKQQVIVGNIGTVYEGESITEAGKVFNEYRNDSIANYGRAAGEPVTWINNDNVYKEHPGANWEYEYTDTFGGEANYAWVKRGSVYAKGDPVQTVKKDLGLTGVACRREDFGDAITLYPRGACTVIFITWKN